MTHSKAIVTIGSTQDFAGLARQVGAEYRPLQPTEELPAIELFRLHKYQEHYDQVLYVGTDPFAASFELFERHAEGSVFRIDWNVFLVDKFCPRIFKPADGDTSNQAAYDLIESRIQKREGGAGTELKSIFAYLGYPGCQRCAATAQRMDLNGVQWCRDSFATIVNEIVSNVRANGIPINPRAIKGIKSMLTIAIERAEGFHKLTHKPTLFAAKKYLEWKPGLFEPPG